MGFGGGFGERDKDTQSNKFEIPQAVMYINVEYVDKVTRAKCIRPHD